MLSSPRLVLLGATGPATLSDDQSHSMGDMLTTLASEIESARAGLLDQVSFLVEARSIAGAVGFDDVWTADRAQSVSDANATALYAVTLLQGAASGDRRTFLQPDGSWGIEKLPNDPYAIDLDPQTGLPALFQGNAVVHPPNTLGLGPLVILGIVAGTVAIWALVAWTIRTGIEAATSIVERAADVYSKKMMYQCLDTHGGPVCDSSLKLQQEQAAALLRAEAEKKATVSGADQATVDITKYAVIGAVLLAGTYAAVKLVPPFLDDRKASRAHKAA